MSRRSALCEAARTLALEQAAEHAVTVATVPSDECAPAKSRAQRDREASRERRLDRYEAIRKLAAAGYSKRAIARELGPSRTTVRRLLAADEFLERATPRRSSRLDAYADYMRSRWDNGCRNAQALWRELVERGYRGCSLMVRRYVRAWRPAGCSRPGSKPLTEHEYPRLEPVIVPSPRQAMWRATREEDAVEEKDRQMRARLLATCEEASIASELALSSGALFGSGGRRT